MSWRRGWPVARLRGLLLALGLVAGLTGCVEVPASSPVQFANPTDSPAAPAGVTVYPAGPAHGDTPVQIVSGFLEAMASYQPGYPVAKEFLTPSARSSWATSSVTVYNQPDSGGLTQRKNHTVRFSAVRTARITDDGEWRSAGADRPMKVDFKMRKVKGQWRIDKLPDGVLMSSFDVDREFSPYDLYFFDTSFKWLIPDRRFLPSRSSVETLLIARLAAGPSGWLAPVVRTSFPEGSASARMSPTVTLSGANAKVTVGDKLTSLTDDQRNLLYAQISMTLAQVGVTSVEVSTSKGPLTVKGEPNSVPVSEWSRYSLTGNDPTGVAYAFDGRGLKPLGPKGTGQPMLDLLAGTTGRSCAVSPAEDAIAIVSPKGTQVTIAEVTAHAPLVVARGTSFAQPSFDRFGDLWLVDGTASGSHVYVWHADQLLEVPIGSLADERITALRVSEDGVRAALVVADQSGDHLVIARVDRAANGKPPPKLSDPIRLSAPVTKISGLSWSDLDTLLVLGAKGGAPLQPYEVAIDGSTGVSIGSSPSASSIAADQGQPLLLGGTDGTISSHESGYRWKTLGKGRNPCYPG